MNSFITLLNLKGEIMPGPVMTIFKGCNVAVNYSERNTFKCPVKKKNRGLTIFWCLLLRRLFAAHSGTVPNAFFRCQKTTWGSRLCCCADWAQCQSRLCVFKKKNRRQGCSYFASSKYICCFVSICLPLCHRAPGDICFQIKEVYGQEMISSDTVSLCLRSCLSSVFAWDINCFFSFVPQTDDPPKFSGHLVCP